MFATGWFLLSVHYKNVKLSKGAKIRNRTNQVPHPTQDTFDFQFLYAHNLPLHLKDGNWTMGRIG